jgi:hypothetical protein
MSRRGRGGRNRNHQNRNGGPDGNQQQSQGKDHGRDQSKASGYRSDPRQPQNQQQQPQRQSQVVADSTSSNTTTQGRTSFPSALQPRRAIQRPAKEMMVAPKNATKTYKAVFFDTLNQAKADLENLRSLAANCDQLNIIVRAEASMDDPELNAVGKLFCGAAWALIHERRKTDGWYEAPRE